MWVCLWFQFTPKTSIHYHLGLSWCFSGYLGSSWVPSVHTHVLCEMYWCRCRRMQVLMSSIWTWQGGSMHVEEWEALCNCAEQSGTGWAEPLNGEHHGFGPVNFQISVTHGTRMSETWQRMRLCRWHSNYSSSLSSTFCISRVFGWISFQSAQ